MKRKIFIAILLLSCIKGMAQEQTGKVARITLLTLKHEKIADASVFLLKKDSSLIKIQRSDIEGKATFTNLSENYYIIKVTHLGYETTYTDIKNLQQQTVFEKEITLQPAATVLQGVTITSKTPFIQFQPDKTVINVEAGITNAGASIMDVLEKSPGITIGRDGTISMKGKPQVMVLIDGKPTQLSGADLQAYLSGISASQVDIIELIDSPGAKYDAAGNAGIINIKTKKSRQKGFNGNASLSVGQGFYSKGNHSLNINYRVGKVNLYANYGTRLGKEKMNLYALRKYFDSNGKDSLLLDQPNFTKTKIGAHNLKAGIDFFASANTTIGIAFTGNRTIKDVNSFSKIEWMTPSYIVDSTINTWGTRDVAFNRAGINFNLRQNFSDNSEIIADIDFIRFNVTGNQDFQTQVEAPGSDIQATKGSIPSRLDIFAAKIDYAKTVKQFLIEAGAKTAGTNTDNLAEYKYHDGNTWQNDLGRSNHFLYDEKTHSVYSSVDAEMDKWHWQAGLRYEITSYKANQLGNAVIKDSAFHKNYGSLFPSAFVSYQADSNNTFTVKFGRRIDRPPFQNLNPFIITINKYTFQGGNPFIKPQYTWNIELNHNYKQVLSTGISYSYLKDYFSQIFIIDSNSSNVNKNTIIYTRGNVGTFKNFAITASLQLPLTNWWNLIAAVVYNHKIIEGVVWAPMKANVNQVNISLNNQFRFGKGWAAEFSGYYLSKSQIDLQESLTPQGEMGAGISKQVLKNKGSVRLSIRDMFYTQNYSGYSHFQNADEPFTVKWDSRVVRITFNWRFGKQMKAIKRSAGGASEETERVNSGN